MQNSMIAASVYDFEAARLQHRIHEISLVTRLTLADAARHLREEMVGRKDARDETRLRAAELLEHLAFGED